MAGRTLTYFASDVHLGLDVKDPAAREARFVAFLKRVENEDVIDGKISYNPFKIRDI